MNSPKAIKIFNDPVHGFIEVPKGLLVDLLDHPIVQRLRYISQMGFSSLVYTSAVHTRFAHAMGALHLITQAMRSLQDKGTAITEDEWQATQLAMLLHDLGHGPLSHALEYTLIPGINHETIGLQLLHRLNADFEGKLTLAIRIFTDQYPEKPFLHQLVSGQLDMDRMDYLLRDSFFTGVHEGTVGADRLIKTLNVVEGQLVVEEKGIYSVEKFIVARRLMYWQVYLHRTSIVSEKMVVRIIQRARELEANGRLRWLSPELKTCFSATVLTPEVLEQFIKLNDIDLLYAIKQWQTEPDFVLSHLAQRLMHRKLLKLAFYSEAEAPGVYHQARDSYAKRYGLTPHELGFIAFTDTVGNRAYVGNNHEPIRILRKNGTCADLLEVSDMPNIQALTQPVIKKFACYPT
jgi:HD superfamily phosphohydrolase